LDVLILTHAPLEGAGNFGEVLDDAGATVRTVAFHETPAARPDLANAELILSMGGPMGANDDAIHPWIATELELLARAVRGGRKVLGICLGSQLLARALGGTVRRGPSAEIGYFPITLTPEGRDDPVLAGLKQTETVLHWHQDTFELPPSSALLASSERSPNQAFRVGRHAYGLQFHIEVDKGMLGGWLEDPASRSEVAGTPGAPTPEALLDLAAEHEKRLTWLCSSVLNRLVNLI